MLGVSLDIMELTEKDAEELNKLCEFSLQYEEPFNIELFLRNKLKRHETKEEVDHYTYLLTLGKQLMEKYGQQWYANNGNSFKKSINTKPFLDQGGFIAIWKRERQEKNIKDLTEDQLKKSIFQLKYWWLLLIINLIISVIVAWLIKALL